MIAQTPTQCIFSSIKIKSNRCSRHTPLELRNGVKSEGFVDHDRRKNAADIFEVTLAVIEEKPTVSSEEEKSTTNWCHLQRAVRGARRVWRRRRGGGRGRSGRATVERSRSRSAVADRVWAPSRTGRVRVCASLRVEASRSLEVDRHFEFVCLVLLCGEKVERKCVGGLDKRAGVLL